MFALPRLSTASPTYKTNKAKPAASPKFGAILAIDLGGRGSARFSVVPEAEYSLARSHLYRKTFVKQSSFQKPVNSSPKKIYQYTLDQWAHQLIKLIPDIYDSFQTGHSAGYDPNKDKIRAIAISFPGTVEDGKITQARNMDQTYGFKWSGISNTNIQKSLLEALQKILPTQAQRRYWSHKLKTKELPIFLYNDAVSALRGEIEDFGYLGGGTPLCSLMEVKIGTGVGAAVFTSNINLPQCNWIRNLSQKEAQAQQTKIQDLLKNTPDQIQTTSLGAAPAINPLARRQETVEDYFSHNGFIKQAKRFGLVSPGMQDNEIPAKVIDWAFNKQAPQHEKAKLIVETGIETLATALAFFASSRNTNLEIRIGGGIVTGIEQAAHRYGYISYISHLDPTSDDYLLGRDGYLLGRLRREFAERMDPYQPGRSVRIYKDSSYIRSQWSNLLAHLPDLYGAALLAENDLNPNPRIQVLV